MKMQKKPFLQIVIASVITILSVTAMTNATTIGTNISTGGTLTVTGASTLTGNTAITGTLTVTGATSLSTASSTGTVKFATINSDTGAISFGDENLTTTGNLSVAIATSTSALVASSTFRAFGTTREGTGTYIETFAYGTEALGMPSTSNGINFKKYDGTIYGSMGRVYHPMAGAYFSELILKDTGDDDLGGYINLLDSNGYDIAGMNWGGFWLGSQDVDNASTTDFIIYDPTSGCAENKLFEVDGNTGNITTCGTLAVNGTAPLSFTTSILKLGANLQDASIDVNNGVTNLYIGTSTAQAIIIGQNGIKTSVLGNFGVGTTTQTAVFQATTASANATTTVELGKTGQNKGTCLKMYDVSGTLQYVSIQGGSLVVSATSCQ